MAYCKKCGAYIPDGETKCLACGYDEQEDIRKTRQSAERDAGYAAQGSFASEYKEQKEEYERQRRQQEEERARQRRERQEENREWARQEYKRRQAEKAGRTGESSSDRSSGAGYYAYRAAGSVGKHKALAILSYINILFILPMIFCKEDKFAMYHAKQGLGLFVFTAIANIIAGIIPFLAVLIWPFNIYCIICGIKNAAEEKTVPLPIIGKYIKS